MSRCSGVRISGQSPTRPRSAARTAAAGASARSDAAASRSAAGCAAAAVVVAAAAARCQGRRGTCCPEGQRQSLTRIPAGCRTAQRARPGCCDIQAAHAAAAAAAADPGSLPPSPPEPARLAFLDVLDAFRGRDVSHAEDGQASSALDGVVCSRSVCLLPTTMIPNASSMGGRRKSYMAMGHCMHIPISYFNASGARRQETCTVRSSVGRFCLDACIARVHAFC